MGVKQDLSALSNKPEVFMTDTEIRIRGLEILSENPGKVDAERFIALINREPFDYTAWQQGLLDDIAIRDLSILASNYQKLIDKELSRKQK
jgi:hypothetical protein